MSELTQSASARRAVPDTTTVTDRGLSRADLDEVVAEVRQVARREVDRATEAFQQRATSAARELQPLITEYTSRLLRWLKILAIVAVVALIGWIVFSAVAEVTLWEWLGDRIDALTD